MNRSGIRILIAAVLLGWSFALGAQTAKWIIKPMYTSITPYCDGVYKVKKGYKAGLIGEDGAALVPATADSITNLSEGYGLILSFEGGKYKLNGIFGENKTVIPVTDDYYVDQYPFFSEGKLPVCNQKGKYGYINNNGRLVLDFEYSTVHPFSEGWAAVSKKNLIGNVTSLIKKSGGGGGGKIIYINEEGKPLVLQAEIGDIYSGTTFKNGEALVTNKENKQYIINPVGAIVRIDNNIPLIFDEKYCLVSEADKNKATEAAPVKYDGPTVYTENDLYGYRQGTTIILPAQFSEAMPFSNGYAIAGKDGKKGMLKLVNGTFSGKQAKGSLPSSDPQTEAIDYIVSVPAEWRSETLKLTFVDAAKKDNIASSLPGDGAETRTFSFLLPKGKASGEIVLEDENLVLWETGMKGAASAAIPVKITVPAVAKANEKDNAFITVRLENKNPEAIETTVKISGDRISPVEKKITLHPNSSQSVSTYFYKVTKEENRSIVVETSVADKITKAVKVKQFFTEF